MRAPARNSDPTTSHAAAAHIAASGKQAAQQQIVVATVRAYPGRTSLELAQVSSLDRYVLARRLPECEQLLQLRRGAAKRCSVSGRTAVTWWPPGVEEQLPLQIEDAAP